LSTTVCFPWVQRYICRRADFPRDRVSVPLWHGCILTRHTDASKSVRRNFWGHFDQTPGSSGRPQPRGCQSVSTWMTPCGAPRLCVMLALPRRHTGSGRPMLGSRSRLLNVVSSFFIVISRPGRKPQTRPSPQITGQRTTPLRQDDVRDRKQVLSHPSSGVFRPTHIWRYAQEHTSVSLAVATEEGYRGSIAKKWYSLRWNAFAWAGHRDILPVCCSVLRTWISRLLVESASAPESGSDDTNDGSEEPNIPTGTAIHLDSGDSEDSLAQCFFEYFLDGVNRAMLKTHSMVEPAPNEECSTNQRVPGTQAVPAPTRT
jgi:hypothetical protein